MRTVAIVIFLDFQLLDAAGPIAVFDTAARESTPPSYRLRVIAKSAGPVTSSSGAQLIAENFFDDPLDTLIVAGGWGEPRSRGLPRDTGLYPHCQRSGKADGQRVLGSLYSGGSWTARRPPRHHPLGPSSRAGPR